MGNPLTLISHHLFVFLSRDDSEDEPPQKMAQSLLSFFAHKDASTERPLHRFFHERKLNTVTNL